MNTENNRIIAEFMDLKPVEVFGNYSISKDHVSVNCENSNDAMNSFCQSTKYHSDWNWLMEVVEKIETKKYYKKEVQFSITKYSVKIQTLTNEDGLIISPCIFSSWGTYGGTQKMKAIYNACLEFIKWYNLQNS